MSISSTWPTPTKPRNGTPSSIASDRTKSTSKQSVRPNYEEKFEDLEYKKMMRRGLTMRTSTIKLSMVSQERLKIERKKQEKRAEMLRSLALNKELKKANRERILEVLRLDSSNWFEAENIEERLLNYTMVPDISVSHTEYYRSLQSVSPLHADLASERVRGVRRLGGCSLPEDLHPLQELAPCPAVLTNQGSHQAPQEIGRAKPDPRLRRLAKPPLYLLHSRLISDSG
jgi:hypothetical protein